MKFISSAFLLSLLLTGCAINSTYSPVQTTNSSGALISLPASHAYYVNYKKQLTSGDKLSALTWNGQCYGLLSFDPDILYYAGKVSCKKIKLTLGVQWLNKSQKYTGMPMIHIYPMITPIASLTSGQKLSLKSGVNYEKTIIAQYKVPQNITKQSLIEFSLPTTDIAYLKKGLLLKMSASKKPEVLQINYNGPKASSRKIRPTLEITYQTDSEMLDLHPKVKPVFGTYVTRKGPDFYYGNKKIRLTGLNVGVGSMKSYEAIDNAVNRLRNMNINGLRVWATGHPFYTEASTKQGEMTISQKGDGSKLDLYDYFIYKVQEAGMFIHNTSLGTHTPPMQYWPGNRIMLERKNKNYDHNFFNVFPIMPYLDKVFMEARIKHIKMYLNRVNPYTGQRYAEMPVFATWELTNENHTVAYILNGKFNKWHPAFKKILTKRWNQWLKQKYKTNQELLKKWGKLSSNENLGQNNIALAPTYKQVKQYPLARAKDFIQFVQELFIKGTKTFEAAARSCAPEGVGINVAPIVANTHADLNMHAQYASSVGDFVSCGIYQTSYTTNSKMPFYPWRPIFSERPYYYNLNYQTIKNKPFVVYENSFFRPNEYRAEWAPAITLLGAGLGWDAIYYYIFGQTWAISDKTFTPLSFMSKRLPIPPNTSHDGYCVGFHHGNDEVFMASLAVSGQAFINGIKPNKEDVTVTFGKSAIHHPGYKNYSPSGSAAKTPNRIMAAGETEWYAMPNIYRKFMHTSVRKRLLLDFDKKQHAAIKVKGKLLDNNNLRETDKETLKPSDDITWEPKQNRFILDCKHSKLIAGIIKNGYEFKDQVKLLKINKDFAFFGISSREGKSLEESSDIILTVTSKSHNTDYQFDPKKIKGSVLGQINGVTNRGKAPVIVDRVAAEITIPKGKRLLKCYNFAGYCYRQEWVDGKVTFSDKEPLFIARLLK